jgi:anti-sigma B factor antagonist
MGAAFQGENLEENIRLVAISGELDLASSGDLRRHVDQALRDNQTAIVIDLSAVTHMDSTGLAALIAAHQQASARRGRLALVLASRHVRRTLEVRGLDRLFTITGNRETALNAVRPPETG